jgi:hypothetical protein
MTRTTVAQLEAIVRNLSEQNIQILEQLQQLRNDRVDQPGPTTSVTENVPPARDANEPSTPPREPTQEEVTESGNWTEMQFREFETPVKKTLFTNIGNNGSPKGVPNSTFKKYKKKTKELLLNHPNLLEWSVDEVAAWTFNICTGTTEADIVAATKTANTMRNNRIDSETCFTHLKRLWKNGYFVWT